MAHKILLSAVMLSMTLTLGAQNKNAGHYFEELDQCIADKKVYTDAKTNRIQDLAVLLDNNRNSLSQKFDICTRLYEEYKSFQYDSAYAYATRMLNIAEKMKDQNLIGQSKIALSFSCRSGGLYKEAYDLLCSIDPNTLNDTNKSELYAYHSSFNLELAQFFQKEPYRSHYYQESFYYAKMVSPFAWHGSAAICTAKARVYALEKDYRQALTTAFFYLRKEKPYEHGYAMISADIADYYLSLKDTAQAIRYYVASSIADIKSATKETTSITALAKLLYKQKDFKRAHNYIMQGLENANFYNALQRKIQITSILPIIEAERFDMVKQQKNNLFIYAVAISILVLLFLIAIVIILKQTKRLNAAKELILEQNEELRASNQELTNVQERISKQNKELLQINEKLKETQRIKEEYIGYFFSANSAFLQKMEDYRKLVNRKIRNKQLEELIQITNSSDIQQEREQMFALFDQIFLKLFPDFVNHYNQLFHPEDQVILKTNNILTLELRIFALIRLGINESERIASFLDYSVHTVNNYKTKVKNRSIVPNESFEHEIMKIESIKTIIN